MTIPPSPRPAPTQHPLKAVLWTLFTLSMTTYFLESYGLPIIQYLSLSLGALSSGYVWTLFTYPFTYGAARLFDLLFHLGFNLFLFWVFGIPILDRVGSTRFLILFFGATISAGLAAAFTLFLFHSTEIFSGPSPALLALVTTWTILHAQRGIQLTHVVFRPFWIFAILVGLNLLLDALSGDWIRFSADSTAALFAYFFCLISERTRSSIAALYPFERFILRSLERSRSPKKSREPKIIDFRTGLPVLDDKQFMDAMLDKISKFGEEKLHPEERERMKKISSAHPIHKKKK